jgi:hypothetical protein
MQLTSKMRGAGPSQNRIEAVQKEVEIKRPAEKSKGDASAAIARAAKTRRVLWICLCISVGFNLIFPLWDRWMESQKTAFTILDLASGSLIVSPLSDPSSSKELIETMSSWATRALLDRNPGGFDDETTLRIMFLKTAYKKAEKEWETVKEQYSTKALRQHVEISLVQAQATDGGIILVRVEGQLIITGVVNGEAIQEVQPVAINFRMARNPDLGRNKRYPLAVFDYEYTQKDSNGQEK